MRVCCLVAVGGKFKLERLCISKSTRESVKTIANLRKLPPLIKHEAIKFKHKKIVFIDDSVTQSGVT